MKIKITISFIILFMTHFGFAQNDNLISLTSKQNNKETWRDLVFTITKREKLDNNFWSLICKAKYKKQIVGLKIKIQNNIPAGFEKNGMPKNNAFIKGGVEFISLGIESDNLLKAISELYGQEPIQDSKFTNDKLNFTVFPLNTEIGSLEKGKFHFKLFFDENNEKKLYSEFYLDPDLKKGIVEINEKDQQYRSNIVRLLSD